MKEPTRHQVIALTEPSREDVRLALELGCASTDDLLELLQVVDGFVPYWIEIGKPEGDSNT